MAEYSLNDIKKELKQLPSDEVLTLFAEVLKLSKANKAYAAYRLFKVGDEDDATTQLLTSLEAEVKSLFDANYWSFNKMIKRIYSDLNKAVKPIKDKERLCHIYLSFAEFLFVHRSMLGKVSHHFERYYVFAYKKALSNFITLHEDAQYDYTKRFAILKNPDQ